MAVDAPGHELPCFDSTLNLCFVSSFFSLFFSSTTGADKERTPLLEKKRHAANGARGDEGDASSHQTFRPVNSWSLGNSSFLLRVFLDDPCPTLRYKYFPGIPSTQDQAAFRFTPTRNVEKRRILPPALSNRSPEERVMFFSFFFFFPPFLFFPLSPMVVTTPLAANFSNEARECIQVWEGRGRCFTGSLRGGKRKVNGTIKFAEYLKTACGAYPCFFMFEITEWRSTRSDQNL